MEQEEEEQNLPCSLETLRKGPPLLHRGGEPFFAESADIGVAVAVYLILTRAEETRREHLVRLFQSSGGGGLRRSHLRQIRHTFLKKFGTAAIGGTRETIRWELPIQVDAERLERLTLDSMPDDTLAFYHGHFLEDWDEVRYAMGFREWVKKKRTALQEQALALLNERAESLFEAGEWNRVEVIGERIAELFPDRNEGHQWVQRSREQRDALAREEAAVQRNHQRADADGDPVADTASGFPHEDESSSLNQGESQGEIIAADPGSMPPRSDARRVRSRAIVAVLTGLIVLAIGLSLAMKRGEKDGAKTSAQSPEAVPICGNGTGQANLEREIYYQGSGVDAGAKFRKGWVLENEGACAWAPGFTLVFIPTPANPTPRLNTSQTAIRLGRFVRPHDTVTIRVPMQAPDTHAIVHERWALLDASGSPVTIKDSRYLIAEFIVRKRPVPLCRPEQVAGELAARSHDDNQTLPIGEEITGSWSLLNRTLCGWSREVALRRMSSSPGHLSGNTEIVFTGDTVLPGDRFTFDVPMRVPRSPGPVREDWELVAQDGSVREINDGGSVYLRIVGVEPGTGAHTQARACGPGEAVAGFLGEQVRDGTRLPPDTAFRKVWTLRNAGKCRWEAPMKLRFSRVEGVRMSTTDAVSLKGQVLPGGAYSFSVPMRTPTLPGEHSERWELVNKWEKVVSLPNADAVWTTIVVASSGSSKRPN
jgi:DNA-binding SARP family transcriptional activator